VKKKTIILILIISVLNSAVYMASGNVNRKFTTGNKVEMLPKLSDYHIFQGTAPDLKPTDNFMTYELSAGLFTDYAEKQRLIKVLHHLQNCLTGKIRQFRCRTGQELIWILIVPIAIVRTDTVQIPN